MLVSNPSLGQLPQSLGTFSWEVLSCHLTVLTAMLQRPCIGTLVDSLFRLAFQPSLHQSASYVNETIGATVDQPTTS